MKCCVRKLLRVLQSAHPSVRKELLSGADKDLVIALCECALNVLKGNVPLTSIQKKKLSVYKNLLRQLSCKEVSLEKKKTILVQQGRGLFLPLLLTPIISKIFDYIIR